MPQQDERRDDYFMGLAIAEAERARGKTGDNPWVGSVIVAADGDVIARGHTQGPGEDHAEIVAVNDARREGRELVGTTIYSTLEPCSFHGRTPACARVVVRERFARLVFGMRDPHPRVDGEGSRMIADAGVVVREGVREEDVRRQLGAWVLAHHPHEPHRRLAARPESERAEALASIYGVDLASARAFLAQRRPPQ